MTEAGGPADCDDEAWTCVLNARGPASLLTEVPVERGGEIGPQREFLDVPDPNPEIRRLLQGRPSSHRPGTLPRDYIPKGEAVLFETRPSLWPYLAAAVGVVVLGAVLAISVWILFLTTGDTQILGVSSTIWSDFAGLLVGLAGLGVVLRLIEWYFTSYAITNRRVIRKTGWISRLVVDARFEKIQAVSFTETTGTRLRGFGNLLFSLSTLSPPLSPFSGLQQGGILWFALPQPLEVRSFVEDTFDTFARFDRDGTRLVPGEI